MGGVNNCDGNPDLEVATRLGLRMPQLGRKSNSQAFQRGFCLYYHQYVHQDYGRREMAVFTEEGLQLLMIFLPLHSLDTLIWRLMEVVGGIYVHVTYVENTVRTLVEEVLDHKASILI